MPTLANLDPQYRAMIESGATDIAMEPQVVLERLHDAGATTVTLLQNASFEALMEAGFQRIPAETLARKWRSADPDPISTPLDTTFAKAVRGPSALSDEELIDKYDPNAPTNDVGRELYARHNGRPLLVFNVDAEFDRAATKEHYATFAEGHNLRDEYFYSDGTCVKTYPAGQRPDQVFDTSPFAQKTPIVRDRCPVTKVDLTGVSRETRQFLAVAVQTNELDPKRRFEIKQAIKQSNTDDNPIKALSKEFPVTAVRYRELLDLEQLPSLKIKKGFAQTPEGDPFFKSKGGHKRY